MAQFEVWNYDVLLWSGDAESADAARQAMWAEHPLYRSMTTQTKNLDKPDLLSVLPGKPNSAA